MEKNKIYTIVYRGFEFDDIGYTSLYPIKFYSTKEKRDKAFEEIVAKELQWFEKCKADSLKYYDKERVEEDYTIEVNDGSTLELYMGNWCYEWGKAEFELEE